LRKKEEKREERGEKEDSRYRRDTAVEGQYQ